MINPRSRVLVLAPHTDDGELGCGATVSWLLEKGSEVYYCAFSDCEKSLPQGFAPGTLRKEMLAATTKLGIPESNVSVLDYDVRLFADRRQNILDDMIRLNREIRPEIVFLPSGSDVHQDHNVIYSEGKRAYKYSTILSYELPWNQISFSGSLLVKLEQSHLDKKISALSEYRSQAHRTYMTAEFITSLASVRGVQANTRFAEAFEVVRIIL